MTGRRASFVVLAIACAFALGGCSSGAQVPGGGSSEPVTPDPPAGEVLAQGTVMDVDGTVELCLGAVAESYPPQCSGIPVADWSWEGVDGQESVEQVTWGAYAVQGTYDGEEFTVTRSPVMLALYDPMPVPDPTGGEAGMGKEEDLAAIEAQAADIFGDDLLSVGMIDGWVRIAVVWDDGTWQDEMDAAYGEGLVIVDSALRLLDD